METLKKHMEKYNLTPKQIAEMSGVNLRTVHAHLSGGRNIGHRTAIKYSQELGISLEKLLLQQDIKN